MDRTAARIHVGLSGNTNRNQISVFLDFYQYWVKVAGDGPVVARNLSLSVNTVTFLHDLYFGPDETKLKKKNIL